MDLSNQPPAERSNWRGLLEAVAVVALCSLVATAASTWLAESDIVMVFLLGVLWCAYRGPFAAAVVSAVGGVAAFDYLFIPPKYTFAVADTRYLLTFVTMAVVGVVASVLVSRQREIARSAQRREAIAVMMFEWARDIGSLESIVALAEVTTKYISEKLGLASAIFVEEPETPVAYRRSTFWKSAREGAVRRALLERNASEDFRKDASAGLYYTMRTRSGAVIGLLALGPDGKREGWGDPLVQTMMETLANQLGHAIERSRLRAQHHQTQVRLKGEQSRNALLSSVSHDLRTPIASLVGASSTLLDLDLPETTRIELLQTIHEEARRLDRTTQNLLEMSRLQATSDSIRQEWHSVEEVLGTALKTLRRSGEEIEVTTDIEDDATMGWFDATLFELALLNLAENAIRHGGSHSIHVEANVQDGQLRVSLQDSGRGVRDEDIELLFQPFVRGHDPDRRGTGLGLSICQAVVETHGGRVEADNIPTGGFRVTMWLPFPEGQPFTGPPTPRSSEVTG